MFDLQALRSSNRPRRKAIGFILIGLSAFSLYTMPVATTVLLMGLVAFFIVQILFPFAWLYVLPAVIIVLDLTPWSGHFFWDESDAFLALITGSLLITNAPRYSFKTRRPKILIAVLSTIWAWSALAPIIPLPTIDLNSFNNYFSSFNALRVAKGFFWALVLMPYLAAVSYDWHSRIAFMRGIISSSAMLALWVVVERQLFSGIMNLSDDFRVTGPLSTMHTGGGHIETLIVVLFPFVVYWMLIEKGFLKLFVAPTVVVGLGYSLLVTYARAGYGAFFLSMFLMLILLAFRFARLRSLGAVAKPALLALVGIGVLGYLLPQSSYVGQRMVSTEKDVGTRLHHWANSLDMMDPDLPTRLLGMGLGQYPVTYAFRNPDGLILASYRFSGTREDPYLELGAGTNLYYEQIVDLRPNTTYTLAVDIKSTVDEGSFSAPVCEKAMLYSFKCEWITLRYEGGTGAWQNIEYAFYSGEVGGGDIFNDRPVKISLSNLTRNSIISLDNIKLVDAQGNNLIRNGDFSGTNDRWFFSTDNHLPWHTKQLAVQIYFSQGLLGLSAFLLLLVLTVTGLLKAGFEGDAFSIALVSSIVAFASIGLFSSPFDAPRLTLIFFSLLFLANHHLEKRSLRASDGIH